MDRLEAIVRHYHRYHWPRLDEEHSWFAGQATLADAIRLAGLAEGRDGKRLAHGNRLKRDERQSAATALLAAAAFAVVGSSRIGEPPSSWWQWRSAVGLPVALA
jgi:hypothetical protein